MSTSVRVQFDIRYSVSENREGGKELGQAPPWFGINDMMDDGGTFRRRITAGATDVLIDINGLTTCRFLTIKCSQTISFKQNSSANTPTTVRALGIGALDGIFLMTTDSITSLYVSNPGATDAEVVFTMAGTI